MQRDEKSGGTTQFQFPPRGLGPFRLFAGVAGLSVLAYFAFQTFNEGKYLQAIIGFLAWPVFLALCVRRPSLFLFRYAIIPLVLMVACLI